MTPKQTAMLVYALLFLLILLAFFMVRFAIIWYRRKVSELMQNVRNDIAASGEALLCGPEAAYYEGSTKGVFKATGNAIAALSSKRLVYQMLFGKLSEIKLSDVKSVSENIWFQGKMRNFRKHLILEMKDGVKVAFFFKNHLGWMNSLNNELAKARSQSP